MNLSSFVGLVIFSVVTVTKVLSQYSQYYCDTHQDECANCPCDATRFLSCSPTLFCECSNNVTEVFFPGTQSCHLKPQATCSQVPGAQQCVPNSGCFHVDNLIVQCVCDFPLSPSLTGNLCRLPYDSSCDRQNDFCDEEAGLECSWTHRCLCVDAGDSVMYSPGGCKVLHGGHCNSTSPGCIPDATCVTSTCLCDTPFYPNSNRECVLPHGQSCTITLPDRCDSESHLECNRGTCQCKQLPYSVFDPTLQDCFLLINSSCIQKPGINQSIPDEELRCHPDALCDPITDKCICTDIMVPSEDKTKCVLKHNDPCTPLIDRCDTEDELACLLDPITGDYLCLCANPAESWWDPVLKECKSLIDVPCDDSSDCVDQGECLVIVPPNATCKCISPTIPNLDKQCFLPYQEKCTEPPGINDPKCDPLGFLYCDPLYMICICMDELHMIYEPPFRACAWIPGVPCTVNYSDPTSGSHPEPICVEHAYCSGSSSVCICEEGYEVSRNGETCILSYGSECSPDKSFPGAVCNDENGLICVDKKCQCRPGTNPHWIEGVLVCLPGQGEPCLNPPSPIGNFPCDPLYECIGGTCQCDVTDNIFIDSTQECYLKAEAPCNPENGAHCVPSSQCLRTSPDGSYSCVCDPFLSSNVDGFCVLKYGQHCSRGNDLCDPTKFLICDHTSRCVCEDPGNSIFYPDDSDGGQCRSLANGPCQVPQPVSSKHFHPCINNTFCSGVTGIQAKCVCNDTFTVDSTRQCVLPYESTCSVDGDSCNKDLHLVCDPTELKCKCPQHLDSYFDEVTQRCFLKSGAFCDASVGLSDLPCAPGSFCDNRTRVCTCISSTLPNKYRQCVLPYGSQCFLGNGSLCDSSGYQECSLHNLDGVSNIKGTLEGHCRCKDPENSHFNRVEKECQLTSHSFCSNAVGVQKCYENSKCTYQPEEARFRCICINESLRPNKEGLCYLPYNASQCMQSSFVCDPAGQLICDLGTNSCQCKDKLHTVYEIPAKSCVLSPGSECELLPHNSEEGGIIPCDNHAQCDFNSLTCDCIEGYESSESARRCMKSFRTECTGFLDGESICNPDNLLECNESNGYCECLFGHFPLWIENDPVKYHCVPGYEQVCLKNPVYLEDSNLGPHYCMPGLRCTFNNTCDCFPNQNYDEGQGKCVALSSDYCIVGQDSTDCPEFSSCVPLVDGSTMGSCRCDEGYVKDRISGACVPVSSAMPLSNLSYSILLKCFVLYKLYHSF